jgi:hypothetical protein
VIIAAATGGALAFLLLVAAVVLVLRAKRNANAIPTGVHEPLAANAAPAGVHAPVNPRQRPRCANDGSCYRQNPTHWADFHHASQDAPVDRPVQGV